VIFKNAVGELTGPRVDWLWVGLMANCPVSMSRLWEKFTVYQFSLYIPIFTLFQQNKRASVNLSQGQLVTWN